MNTPYDQWPLFIYDLEQARLAAKPDRYGQRKGLWAAWSKTSFSWNSRPAGLLKLPTLEGETAEYAASRYSLMFGVTLTAFELLRENDFVSDTFGDRVYIFHGTSHA